MSIDKPAKDKMLKTPPAKKGFHFASDGMHEALYIEAESIEEAEKLYLKHRRPLAVGGTEQSTPAKPGIENKAIQ